MKAAICTKYGSPDVLEIREIEKPIPKYNEILVGLKATTVSSGDARIRGFNVPWLYWLPFRFAMGFKGPRQPILGFDLAGEVEAIGKDVSLFKVGDQVFGSAGFGGGTNAEYICLRETEVITTKPETSTFEEAAAVFFGAHTALHFLKKGDIQKGQKVLIYGASGSLGTYAVQLAKYFRTEVTGVCSTDNIKLIKSLGADHVIDYTKEDFAASGETYDLIFDAVGKSSFAACVKSLKDGGVYLRSVHLKLSSILSGLWITMTTSKKVIGGVAGENVEDILFLKKLLEEGSLKPVIDKVYSLEQIVEAHSYVDSGKKKGNVVVTI